MTAWGPGEGPQQGQVWEPTRNEWHIHGTERCGEERAGGRTGRASGEGREGEDAAIGREDAAIGRGGVEGIWNKT